MYPYNKKLYLTIISAILGTAFLLIAYLMISSKLNNNELYAINLTVNFFLRYSTIPVVLIAVVGCILLFIKKLPFIISSTVCFSLIALFSFYLFISSFTTTDSITDGYGYVFDKEEYLRFGLNIQNHFKCCGWKNTTYIFEEMECGGTLTCRTSVRTIIKSCLLTLSLFSGASLICFGLTLYGCYTLINVIIHPVALFDELVASPLENIK